MESQDRRQYFFHVSKTFFVPRGRNRSQEMLPCALALSYIMHCISITLCTNRVTSPERGTVKYCTARTLSYPLPPSVCSICSRYGLTFGPRCLVWSAKVYIPGVVVVVFIPLVGSNRRFSESSRPLQPPWVNYGCCGSNLPHVQELFVLFYKVKPTGMVVLPGGQG